MLGASNIRNASDVATPKLCAVGVWRHPPSARVYIEPAYIHILVYKTLAMYIHTYTFVDVINKNLYTKFKIHIYSRTHSIWKGILIQRPAGSGFGSSCVVFQEVLFPTPIHWRQDCCQLVPVTDGWNKKRAWKQSWGGGSDLRSPHIASYCFWWRKLQTSVETGEGMLTRVWRMRECVCLAGFIWRCVLLRGEGKTGRSGSKVTYFERGKSIKSRADNECKAKAIKPANDSTTKPTTPATIKTIYST